MLIENYHIILDGAKLDLELNIAKELNPEFDSLYRGEPEESLATVAPYIFSVERGQEFESWYFEKGWGDAWGVLVYADKELKTLRKHFRHFLMVQTEDKQQLYFRFYDPRVLRIFLPTCDEEQLEDFFGPVDYFICEDEDPDSGLVFSLEDGNLKTEKITKEQVMSFEPKVKKKKFLFF
jgi:hypothetical protein